MAARGPINDNSKIDAGTKVWGWELKAVHRAADKRRMSAAEWMRELLAEGVERELGAPLASFNPELQQAAKVAKARAAEAATPADAAQREAIEALGALSPAQLKALGVMASLLAKAPSRR